MPGLCTNRAEGFGPISHITKPLPTQCFFDTILVPTPTWLYLLALPVLFLLGRKRNSSSSSSKGTKRNSSSSTSSLFLLKSWRTRWRQLLLFAAYYFTIAVLALMESVEIAQLGRAGLGLGLLPVIYAGLLAAVALQASDGLSRKLRAYWMASTAFWVAGAAVTGLKIAAVLGLGLQGPFARTGTAYATVHQFTDLVILGAFYVLAVVAEVGVMVVRRRERRKAALEEDEVELRSEFDWK